MGKSVISLRAFDTKKNRQVSRRKSIPKPIALKNLQLDIQGNTHAEREGRVSEIIICRDVEDPEKIIINHCKRLAQFVGPDMQPEPIGVMSKLIFCQSIGKH